MLLVPIVLFLLAATTENSHVVGFAAIGIPVAYTLLAGAGEFVSNWSAKGGSEDPLLIWTDEAGRQTLTPQNGSIDELVALYQAGRTIAHVEQTVRFNLSNFSPLGLNLSLGAITVNVAWLLDGTSNVTFLSTSLAVQVFMSFATYMCMQINRKLRPDQIWLGWLTASFSILFGLFAMILSFSALSYN